MAYRIFELTLLSANGLKDVNVISKMKVYAVVSISGNPGLTQQTPPDRKGGRNPTWASPALRFPIPAGDPGLLALHVRLRTDRLLGDRDVAELFVPLRELLSRGGATFRGSMPAEAVGYPVRKPGSDKVRGVLNFYYTVVDGDGAAMLPPPPVVAPRPKPKDDDCFSFFWDDDYDF